MKKKDVKVVIGAAFGDEGKGLLTDYFASKQPKQTMVVRFNGGAQAAHTVVTPGGEEHVFSHFGSGTLEQVPTYLSRFFISNPLHYIREYQALNEKLDGKMPSIFVDPQSIVTTPFDMLINQLMETLRGDSRHGSCGYGIEETVRRSEDFNQSYALYAKDLWNEKELRKKLVLIQNEYVNKRLSALGVLQVPTPFDSLLNDMGILESFLKDCAFFVQHIERSDFLVLDSYQTIVFEGAQGLLLDQNSSYAPHVTSSNTGLQNVSELLGEVAWGYDAQVVYATRCYATRHGAGTFLTESSSLPYPNISDPTNVPNEWQGTLRFGYINVDELKETIRNDQNRFGLLNASYFLAVTCLDQADGEIHFRHENQLQTQSASDFLELLKQEFLDFEGIYQSWGRTRATLKKDC